MQASSSTKTQSLETLQQSSSSDDSPAASNSAIGTVVEIDIEYRGTKEARIIKWQRCVIAHLTASTYLATAWETTGYICPSPSHQRVHGPPGRSERGAEEVARVMEASSSPKTHSIETLQQSSSSEDSVADSNGTVGTVVGIDIEYGGTKEAGIMKWQQCLVTHLTASMYLAVLWETAGYICQTPCRRPMNGSQAPRTISAWGRKSGNGNGSFIISKKTQL